MNGAVVFLGCTAKQLVDPSNPPSTATGPYVVSGNNRCAFRFLISCRRLICLELIKEKHPESKGRLWQFWMSVYCFRDPSNQAQRLLIRQIGSEENETQSMFIKMSDADKLITCRRNMKDLPSDLKGSLISLINLF